MTPINQTFVLNKDSDLQSNFGWDKIHVHYIYPSRILTRREYNPIALCREISCVCDCIWSCRE